MNTYDVVIIGGGVSGLSCGLVLGSTKGRGTWAENRKILIIDNHHSDALGARFYNAVGLEEGILGRDQLEKMRLQLNRYDNVTQKESTVSRIKEENKKFIISTENGENFIADTIVLATGCNLFKIEGLDLEIVNNKKSHKENKIQIHNENFLVREGIYVAGLLSGVSSHFPIASGSGAQVACDIMSLWAGKNTIVHDKP